MPPPDAPPSRPLVGFVVNPIAGMGGPVALKGTDDALEQARQRGATPVSPPRATRFLEAFQAKARFLTCQDPMGASLLEGGGHPHEAPIPVQEPTTADDTKRAVQAFADAGADLIVFVGGDGTALDVAEAIGQEAVCLGVPGGVKMNSPAFGQTPEHAARVAEAFLAGQTGMRAVEIVEVDEDRLREGRVEGARLGSLRVPEHPGVQPGKASPGGSVEGVIEAGVELATPGSVLVLGPGGTMHALKERLLGREASLLGVDVVRGLEEGGAECLIEDATAGDLEGVPESARIVVSPIGGQGFVLGRGNQQLVPGLLRRVGWDRVVVLATPRKLRELEALRVDTGDRGLDEAAPSSMDVITGPGFRSRVRVQAGP